MNSSMEDATTGLTLAAKRTEKTMLNKKKLEEMKEAEALAYFRAELVDISPESYTLDEKKQISEDMDASSAAIEDAMREDFEKLDEVTQTKLLDMLCASGIESPQWWWDVLVGEGDPLYRELEPLSWSEPTQQAKRPSIAKIGGLPHANRLDRRVAHGRTP